tara:strand:+ start:135 stop:332 length:198 start_codon:yes stop_codon:yes gene_type:complete
MKQVYKLGGDWYLPCGTKYTALTVNSRDYHDYLADGWVSEPQDLLAIEVKPTRKRKAKKDDGNDE